MPGATSKNSNVSAQLKITLSANKTIIAESSDPHLWQNVLAAITSKSDDAEITPQANSATLLAVNTGDNKGVPALAKFIGVSNDVLVGACDPQTSKPYIQLDHKHWADLKKNTPMRGPKSVSASILALTILNLWRQVSGIEKPTIDMAREVIDGIDIEDPNAARAVKNCDWLREKSDGTIVLNPAQQSKAVAIAKAYCLRAEPEYK